MASKNEEKLSLYAKKFLKSEMGRKLIKISDLAKTMEVDKLTLGNKIARGTFSAGFFLEVLQALGTKEMTIPLETKGDYEFTSD